MVSSSPGQQPTGPMSTLSFRCRSLTIPKKPGISQSQADCALWMLQVSRPTHLITSHFVVWFKATGPNPFLLTPWQVPFQVTHSVSWLPFFADRDVSQSYCNCSAKLAHLVGFAWGALNSLKLGWTSLAWKCLMIRLSNKSLSAPMEPFSFRNAFFPSPQNGLFCSLYSLFCWLTLTAKPNWLLHMLRKAHVAL